MVHRYLLLPEAALAARVSVSTVRAWIRQGRLPSTRPGRRRLVREKDLELFLEGYTRKARTRREASRFINVGGSSSLLSLAGDEEKGQ